MTLVTIPNRPLGTDTRSIELLLADFDAITAVINGGLDQSNMSSVGTQALHQPGDIIASAASSRTGCLLCDGSAVSRATYATLFGAIGTTYGAGDGSSTFNLPSLTGRFPLGAGGGAPALGGTGGALGHQHSVPSLSVPSLSTPNHSHSLSSNGGAALGTPSVTVGNGGGAGFGLQWGGGSGPTYTSIRQMGVTFSVTGSTVSETSLSNPGIQGPALYGNTDSGGAGSTGTGATGTGTSGPGDPPYQTVNFFIKT